MSPRLRVVIQTYGQQRRPRLGLHNHGPAPAKDVKAPPPEPPPWAIQSELSGIVLFPLLGYSATMQQVCFDRPAPFTEMGCGPNSPVALFHWSRAG